MAHAFRLLLLLAVLVCSHGLMAEEPPARKFTNDQQLIVAAFELDVAQVRTLLAKGAKPDARLGLYDEDLFEDKWTQALSQIGSDHWTALMAVANSRRAPQPAKRVENTTEGLERARKRLAAVDPKLIAERNQRRVAIARLLIAAKAGLDFEDGHGATALYSSVYKGYDDLSLLLIDAGAEVNTKTGVYIDGPDDHTPLHHAVRSPAVVEALLKRGAKVDATDSQGSTPLYRAVLISNIASVKLLLDAGADPAAKDRFGRSPATWSGIFSDPKSPGGAEKKAIAKLLEDAKPKK